MIKHDALFFFTEESNFEKVKEVLISEFNLVPPQIADAERLLRQLVWEDEEYIGRYRVNFSPGHNALKKLFEGTNIKVIHPGEEFSGPKISFRYWSHRLNEQTKTEDPMRKAYIRVYEMLKPCIVVNYRCENISLDALL